MQRKKRLGFFVFFDSEGIVDRYVLYLLKRMAPFLEELIIIINGEINEEGYKNLSYFSKSIIKRENKGFDAMAVRMALVETCGWNEIKKYDCVVVFNDTFYGPFCKLEMLFEEMDARQVDLWGVLGRIQGEVEGASATFFATFFYVMERALLMDKSWQAFWNEMNGEVCLFQDALDKYERALVPLCEKLGYKWDAYLRSDTYTGVREESAFLDYMNIACELIEYHGFPFLKRKPLAEEPDFSFNLGYTQKKTLEYIATRTDYDIGMILENLIRKYEWWKIKDALKLTKIISSNLTTGTYSNKRTLLIFRVTQAEWIQDYSLLWNNLRKVRGIEVFPETRELYETIISNSFVKNEKVHIHGVCSEIQILEALETMAGDGSFIFYMDDYNYKTRENENLIIGRSVQEFIIQNMLVSDCFIKEVENEFNKNQYLGVMTSINVYNSRFLGKWLHYENNELVKIFPELEKQIYHISNVQALWCRNEIFEEVLAMIQGQICKIAAINMRLPICELAPGTAKKLKKYTEELASTNMAEVALNNQQFMLSNILKNVEKQSVSIDEYRDLKYMELKLFCNQCSAIYIYGAGVWGGRVANKLRELNIELNGFIVSDGQVHDSEKDGYPIYELSQMIGIPDCDGIIVAVAKSRQPAILEVVRQKGYKQVFAI